LANRGFVINIFDVYQNRKEQLAKDYAHRALR
jgi:hypothetical protein